jgi:AraC-like DNA-binding protein
MPASGSSIFTDADGYQAGIGDLLDLLVLRPRGFQARLTWLDLPSLHLVRAQESSFRVAFAALPQEMVFVTFSTAQDSRLIYRGAELAFSDIILHSQGERGHQRTAGASRWGSISLTPASLARFCWSLAGQTLGPPTVGQVLRPSIADRRRLQRLHAQAGRIAEKNLESFANKEVVRAVEQDLILALVNCLTTGAAQKGSRLRHQQASLMVRVEALLASHPHRLLRLRDICSELSTSVSTLNASCAAVLGMGLGGYQRLRRLKLVRTELMRARSGAVDGAELVRRYGFSDLHRFAIEYWKAYGEMPLLPPRGL